MKVLAILSVVMLLFMVGQAYPGEYRATGIVKSIEGNKVLVYVKADDCYGVRELLANNPEQLNLYVGKKIAFRATANPCKYSGDVHLLGIEELLDKDEREQP